MSTVFVTLSDIGYYPKAKQTIRELRTLGKWNGDIVLIAVDFEPDPIDNVILHKVSHISTDKIVESYTQFPFQSGDGRHLSRLTQWDKLQVFTDYFKQWERLVFLDAGMRVLNPVSPLLELDWRGKLLAPDDTQYPPNGAQFRNALDCVNIDAYEALVAELPEHALNEAFFVNCLFVVDTRILYFEELVDAMNRYPICTCNEMGIMNIVYTFRHREWTPLPKKIGDKYVFGWNESQQNGTPGTWKDFLCMKYPFHTPDHIITEPSTAFVTLCDSSYYPRAKKTIDELRSAGGWNGVVVLIAVDFDPDISNVIVYKTTHINTDGLLESFRNHPIQSMPDNRHFAKLYQWDKLQVFKPYFRQWDRIVFVDAGLRIFDSVQPLLDLPWKGKMLGPDDSDPYDNGNRFHTQLDLTANPEARERIFSEFPTNILKRNYFNNCIFVFDTELTYRTSFAEMEDYMNRFPILMCNETGLMNLVFTFKLNCWVPFPQTTPGGKYLFAWAENNYREGPDWTRFHFIKYSLTRA